MPKESVTVDVTNSDGSTTPVVFKKEKDVYVGPKGEHYHHKPTEEEIKLGYGY